ncbi:rubrerythrin [Dehalococcoides mccartyi]|uniref:Rubrerythrin-like protein n=1 Tax=Dehalococcoides mccartyi (strain VS) TaxID=311424 RepID=D2BHW4_DEHMV|nr:rubrerythrin [Dehalococcoides mccartyi]ACZ61914.1 rubrerythrin-like protein [Dehalococcoides mccartyi VS]
MSEELKELIEAAIYKEVASQSLYQFAMQKTDDASVIQLLETLIQNEEGHLKILKDLLVKGKFKPKAVTPRLQTLKLDTYIKGGTQLEGSGLQDILLYAIKEEQSAAEFYSHLMSTFISQEAKDMCRFLAAEELEHKLKLELIYDDLFFIEN